MLHENDDGELRWWYGGEPPAADREQAPQDRALTPDDGRISTPGFTSSALSDTSLRRWPMEGAARTT